MGSSTFCIMTVCGLFCLIAGTSSLRSEEAAAMNLILGTQAIGGRYQFTDRAALVEAAEAVQELGASCMKFALRLPPKPSLIQSLADLTRLDEAHRRVLDMPFRDYFMWVDAREEGAWAKGLTPAQVLREYRQMYELATHLLRTYAGTGKSFYLGHWEGDNMLRPQGIKREGDAEMADAVRVQGFIDWLNVRQQAVDDARRDVGAKGVSVWHYTEVNHPTISLLENRPSIANQVLPKVAVDFVSYSAYDSQSDIELLRRVLDYLQAQIKPKPGLPAKRVFIGEYGFWTRKDGEAKNTPQQQDLRSMAVAQTALEWGCPFILYWQLYNNELDADGRHRGFWMIDDKGVKQPVYETHRAYFAWARRWMAESATASGRKHPESEFREAARAFIKERRKELSR